MSKKFAMDFIKKNVLKCEKCSLYKTRIKPVFGEGFLDADIMFIGEAPGKNEDIQLELKEMKFLYLIL